MFDLSGSLVSKSCKQALHCHLLTPFTFNFINLITRKTLSVRYSITYLFHLYQQDKVWLPIHPSWLSIKFLYYLPKK